MSEIAQSTTPHLLELPPELLTEVFKRLDIKSIENVAKTCKQLETMISNFKIAHKELIKQMRDTAKAYPPACYYDDSDDLDQIYDEETYGNNHEDGDELELYELYAIDDLSDAGSNAGAGDDMSPSDNGSDGGEEPWANEEAFPNDDADGDRQVVNDVVVNERGASEEEDSW